MGKMGIIKRGGNEDAGAPLQVIQKRKSDNAWNCTLQHRKMGQLSLTTFKLYACMGRGKRRGKGKRKGGEERKEALIG